MMGRSRYRCFCKFDLFYTFRAFPTRQLTLALTYKSLSWLNYSWQRFVRLYWLYPYIRLLRFSKWLPSRFSFFIISVALRRIRFQLRGSFEILFNPFRSVRLCRLSQMCKCWVDMLKLILCWHIHLDPFILQFDSFWLRWINNIITKLYFKSSRRLPNQKILEKQTFITFEAIKCPTNADYLVSKRDSFEPLFIIISLSKFLWLGENGGVLHKCIKRNLSAVTINNNGFYPLNCNLRHLVMLDCFWFNVLIEVGRFKSEQFLVVFAA